jgi:very-short-patch-repair endonuclease
MNEINVDVLRKIIVTARIQTVGNGLYVKYRNGLSKAEKNFIDQNKQLIANYLDEGYPSELLNQILDDLDEVDRMTPHVKSYILEMIQSKLSDYIGVATTCESPLEFQLYQSVLAYVKSFNKKEKEYFWVANQCSVRANGHNYRADIMIAVPGHESDKYSPRLIVEVDGHEFHEKTKEQAKRDKERDRNLQMEGYRVMHFTGSEVFHKAYDCASQVIKMLESMI